MSQKIQKIKYKIEQQPSPVPSNWHFDPPTGTDELDAYLGRLVVVGYVLDVIEHRVSGCNFHFLFSSGLDFDRRIEWHETTAGGFTARHWIKNYLKLIHILDEPEMPDEYRTKRELISALNVARASRKKIRLVADVFDFYAADPLIQKDLFSNLDRSNKCPVVRLVKVEPEPKRFFSFLS